MGTRTSWNKTRSSSLRMSSQCTLMTATLGLQGSQSSPPESSPRELLLPSLASTRSLAATMKKMLMMTPIQVLTFSTSTPANCRGLTAIQ